MTRPYARRRRRPLWDRYVEKVDMSGGVDACWPWRGGKSKKNRGYRGIIRVWDEARACWRMVNVARVALALLTDGDLEKTDPATGVKLEACHTCHNGGNAIDCANGRHLYWGTRDDQRRDQRVKRAAEIAAALGATTMEAEDEAIPF